MTSQKAVIDVQVGALQTLIALNTGGPEFVEDCRNILESLTQKQRAEEVRIRMAMKRRMDVCWKEIDEVLTHCPMTHNPQYQREFESRRHQQQ